MAVPGSSLALSLYLPYVWPLARAALYRLRVGVPVVTEGTEGQDIVGSNIEDMC